MPKISIIITTYNRQRYIEKAIESILYYYRIHQNNITNGQRPLVIEYSMKAINLALCRQGLDKSYFLREHQGKYLLYRV